MNKTEIRCPNCGTSFVITNGGAPMSELKEGIHYLVPETIRNENKTNARMEALKNAGVNIDKLQSLMNSNEDFKSIFAEDDPILREIGKGGFIKNNELFRRWITAQTFRLLKDPYGWTHAVRSRFNLRYVFRQTRDEAILLMKLERKGLGGQDKRFSFFTFEDLIAIFLELNKLNRSSDKDIIREKLSTLCGSYQQLVHTVTSYRWYFTTKCSHIPARWLNCYKGAGAYYTLQNIIRTHGFVLPSCKDMNESLEKVEELYNEIHSYSPSTRRWDLMLSLLTSSVKATNFELKY